MGLIQGSFPLGNREFLAQTDGIPVRSFQMLSHPHPHPPPPESLKETVVFGHPIFRNYFFRRVHPPPPPPLTHLHVKVTDENINSHSFREKSALPAALAAEALPGFCSLGPGREVMLSSRLLKTVAAGLASKHRSSYTLTTS